MAINFVQGDTSPILKLVLTDSVSLQPINLTGATINFNVRATGAAVLSFTKVATIVNAAGGIANIVWVAGDLDRAPGNYQAEIEVIDSSGIKETVFDFVELAIREDIA